MSVLRLEHVTKRFGGLVAVNDLSFEVKERQIHALIGPNGSGKSTSINMINGSFPVTSGKIYFNDKDITGWKMHKIAAAGMGRTYQNLKLFRSMTALENVMIGGQLHAKMNFARFLVDPFKTKREEEASGRSRLPRRSCARRRWRSCASSVSSSTPTVPSATCPTAARR